MGFGCAAAVWLGQDRIERRTRARQTNELGSAFTEALPPDDSSRYAYDVEKYYGKSGQLLDKWTRRLQSLAHGKRLAWTLAVASLLVAGGCFFISIAYHPEMGNGPGENKP